MTHPMQAAESPGHVPFIECSECRAPRRDLYYVLNERPVCAQCRVKYDQMIRKRDGRMAMGRIAIQGGLVALVGAISLAVMETVFPAGRIFVLVPIGFFLGKRIMSLLDHYSARRYQYLAVALTYLSFMIGMAIPAIREAQANTRQIAHATHQQEAMKENLREIAEFTGTPLTPEENGSGGSKSSAGSVSNDGGNARAARNFLLLVFFYPVLRMFQFGMGFSAVGILALGAGLFQAWKQTDGQGSHFTLRGPFRVGGGPIAAR